MKTWIGVLLVVAAILLFLNWRREHFDEKTAEFLFGTDQAKPASLSQESKSEPEKVSSSILTKCVSSFSSLSTPAPSPLPVSTASLAPETPAPAPTTTPVASTTAAPASTA